MAQIPVSGAAPGGAAATTGPPGVKRKTPRSLAHTLLQGTMGHDLVQTLIRVLYAFALAAGIGVPIGILIGAKERVYRSVEFLIDFFRSTPSTAMFPLFMLIFGLGEEGKLALAAFAAFLIIVFNVAYG